MEVGLQDSGDLSSSLRDGSDRFVPLTLAGSKFSSSMSVAVGGCLTVALSMLASTRC